MSSLSLVRYRRNDYSVPTSFGHREVIVRGILPKATVAATSARAYMDLLAGAAP